jgi:cyclopropane-fatty-acyl-phospholipid synthase
LTKQIHATPKILDNFLDRYIFPGGYLPSIHRLIDAINIGSKSSLEISTVQSIGPHYVKALRLWREKFERNWEGIKGEYVKSRGTVVVSEGELEAWRRRW